VPIHTKIPQALPAVYEAVKYRIRPYCDEEDGELLNNAAPWVLPLQMYARYKIEIVADIYTHSLTLLPRIGPPCWQLSLRGRRQHQGYITVLFSRLLKSPELLLRSIDWSDVESGIGFSAVVKLRPGIPGVRTFAVTARPMAGDVAGIEGTIIRQSRS